MPATWLFRAVHFRRFAGIGARGLPLEDVTPQRSRDLPIASGTVLFALRVLAPN
ncbi:hypothetical protein [Tabrizicola thermarum]|uniref:hypothetical protein n=1 Tax=Tabrizicola thermarum TaxID=2670345 RepID=UPI0012D809E6|nr:hypothetical protein [Tabrizicola thermarum]